MPADKTADLNSAMGSPVFDYEKVTQVPEWRAHQLLQQLNNTQVTKKRPAKFISDHLSSVHAVTLYFVFFPIGLDK